MDTRKQGRGRPFRKDNKETKSVALRLTEDEIQAIDNAKDALGMWDNRSDLIREAVEFYIKTLTEKKVVNA